MKSICIILTAVPMIILLLCISYESVIVVVVMSPNSILIVFTLIGILSFTSNHIGLKFVKKVLFREAVLFV